MPEIDRRTLVRGAAVSVPVITLATAAPAYAASQVPACPTCLTAEGGAFSLQANVAGGQTQPSSSGSIGFNLDSSSCDLSLFSPGYTIAATGATVTWSDGDTQSWLSAGTGAGTFGAVSAFNMGFTHGTDSTSIPNGTGFLGAYQSNQKEPVAMTFSFTAFFVSITGVTIECNYTASFDLTTNGTGTVAGGTGTVNFSGTASNGTVTPA